MSTLLTKFRNYGNARALSALLASTTPLVSVSCMKTNTSAQTIQAQFEVHPMDRNAVFRAFKNAQKNGKTFDNVEEAAKALKGEFYLRVIGNNINVYKDNRKIGVFVITGKPEVAILAIGDLLAIADKHTIALYGGVTYLIFDCKDKPFEYKPRIGIEERGGKITVVVASSSIGEQMPDVATISTNLSAKGLVLEKAPPGIEISPDAEY